MGMNVKIISASVRDGRESHRVALYFDRYIREHNLGTVELIDLKQYNFPLFSERLQYQENPHAGAREFSEKIKAADGVLIVTPEYNGGYPASLKNVIDLLYLEWKRKPVAITTVSGGPFAGTQVITSLLFTLWKIGALMVPAMFPVPEVEKHYDHEGNALNKEATDKRAKIFIGELFHWMEAARSRPV